MDAKTTKGEPNVACWVALVCGGLNVLSTVYFVCIIVMMTFFRPQHSGGLEEVITHLWFFGPLFCVGIVASLLAKSWRKQVLFLNLVYAMGWIIVAVLDSAPTNSNEDVNATIEELRKERERKATN